MRLAALRSIVRDSGEGYDGLKRLESKRTRQELVKLDASARRKDPTKSGNTRTIRIFPPR